MKSYPKHIQISLQVKATNQKARWEPKVVWYKDKKKCFFKAYVK